MKSFLLILISAVFLIPFSGCKKKSFDPASKTRQDFIGTWKGSISTFKDNKLLKEYGTIYIYHDGGSETLSGILFMKETLVIREFQFVNGTCYFKVVNPDPTNPTCQNWSLEGYTVFLKESEIDIRINGNECGSLGNEFINWVGTLVPGQVSADSVEYYNFGKNGNSWDYQVTMKNGESCQIQKQINQVTADYLCTGPTSQNCGWIGQSRTFKWNVSPSAYSIINDSTISYKPFTIPVYAKPGVVYSTIVSNDTITVTLLDTSLTLSTAAGSFTCARYRHTETVNTGILRTTKTAYLWLNNRYGIIKQTVVNPVDSTSVKSQELISKNF